MRLLSLISRPDSGKAIEDIHQKRFIVHHRALEESMGDRMPNQG